MDTLSDGVGSLKGQRAVVNDEAEGIERTGGSTIAELQRSATDGRGERVAIALQISTSVVIDVAALSDSSGCVVVAGDRHDARAGLRDAPVRALVEQRSRDEQVCSGRRRPLFGGDRNQV